MINQKNKGFTLIELLVVVAIIAILSVVVISAINSAREKGKDSSAMSQMNQARNQAEIYYTKYGNYIGLCHPANTLESGRQGIYDFVLEATKVIGFEPADEYVIQQQVDSINMTYPADYQPVLKSRCRVSGDILVPRWAAHVPLLKKKDGVQQYYCVDSTGAGFVTTIDFASNQGDPGKKYLGCVESQ